ncbi:HNH endonuclease [Pseudomonas anguilliseptica]|uniref:Putative HNH nuclease YajD n=1 Tax=Pseudomonas anguilliseptica TaxID=53406 RepID=A0A1H4UWJ4_PSEAG|nr:HNH endonuclease signature motif containing protein [Pseudomonas anguilliseptica]SEC73242.1 HNH endonuclease [Pseudomonas anguilliseptica]
MAAERRGNSAERGYGYKWQQARAGYLRKHPLCVECQSRGRTVAATVVDHKVAHRGDMTVFWDKANWQSLCKHCHDSWKQRMEKSGRGAGCSVDGIPSAPGHHWHQGGG